MRPGGAVFPATSLQQTVLTFKQEKTVKYGTVSILNALVTKEFLYLRVKMKGLKLATCPLHYGYVYWMVMVLG